MSSVQNFSGLIQQLVQKESQVIELQEELARLGVGNRGGFDEVSVSAHSSCAKAYCQSYAPGRC